MNEAAFNSRLARMQDGYGISALAVAMLLFLAAGDWPFGYYQVLRIAIIALSLAILHREWGSSRSGWLLFAGAAAILFNPLLPLKMDKGHWSLPDLIFAAGFTAYGLQSLSRRAAKMVSMSIWTLLALVLVLTFYVNHYMPHGPSYPTGDVVCQNDDRGPCGDEYKEDTSHLDIPEWAKFLREDFLLVIISLVFSGMYCNTRPRYDEFGFLDPTDE